MKTQSKPGKNTNTIGYRLRRYPRTTALSIALVLILTSLFCYFLGMLYPQFRLFSNLSNRLSARENKKYQFYTGRPIGAYYSIGNTVHGIFGDRGDSICNKPTSGGYENAMKLTIEKNAFGLIQEELINHDDQLRKNVRIVTPLFLERMHILYRKDLCRDTTRELQLSANSDSCVLRCFSDSAIKINMGPVGSGTRIIASYMMAIIEQQINSRLNNNAPRFTQKTEDFSISFAKMKSSKEKKDSPVDILFYLVADPINCIKDVLDAGQYKLMSIDPSFVVLLNKEFGLGLRVADFKDKYASTKNISTLGTLTYLIASKAIPDGVARSLLEKIDASKEAIHRAMITGHHNDTTLALKEIGFFNVFNDEFEASMHTRLKEIIVFLLSALTLFFPVFKSVIGLKYIWQRWDINKKIDEIVAIGGNTPEENNRAWVGIKKLEEKVIDLYGDSLLSETHYNPLMKRIGMYEEKFAALSKEIPSTNMTTEIVKSPTLVKVKI